MKTKNESGPISKKPVFKYAILYFNQTEIRSLDDEWIVKIKHAIIQIPFCKKGNNVSLHIANIRKQYPRSHEPWTTEEVELLFNVLDVSNDLTQIVYLFGRSPNAIYAMTEKWISYTNIFD